MQHEKHKSTCRLFALLAYLPSITPQTAKCIWLLCKRREERNQRKEEKNKRQRKQRQSWNYLRKREKRPWQEFEILCKARQTQNEEKTSGGGLNAAVRSGNFGILGLQVSRFLESCSLCSPCGRLRTCSLGHRPHGAGRVAPCHRGAQVVGSEWPADKDFSLASSTTGARFQNGWISWKTHLELFSMTLQEVSSTNKLSCCSCTLSCATCYLSPVIFLSSQLPSISIGSWLLLSSYSRIERRQTKAC